jgi:hypothetical protein
MLIAIVLGLLGLVGLVMYLAAMVVIWVVLGVFFAFTLVIALLVGDPYVGFVCAIPATGITLWLMAHFSDAAKAEK